MISKSNKRQNLWNLAFESLGSKDQERLQKYDSEKQTNAIDEAFRAVQEKRKACLQKCWTLKTNSGRIIVRDILDKIALWINKFKEVGDVAAQFDPTHVSLPWTGVRFLLQVSINDIQTFASVAEGLETLARLTSRYAIFESVYLPPLGQELAPAQSKLCDALVLLYCDCLKFLVDIGKYYERSTGERIVRSLYELSDRFSNPLKEISVKEAEVEKLAQIIQTESAQQLNTSLAAFQSQNRASFESLEVLLHSFEEPLVRLSDPLVLFQETLELEERRKLLLWLSSDNYREHHGSIYKDVVPGTAQWVFFKSQYQEWQTSSACSILWLHGIPGCGKTKLTSTVIQRHLDATRKNDQSAPISYVYCSNSTRSPTFVLRSIVKQLAVSQSGCKIRRPFWEEYHRRQEAASMDGLDPSPLAMDECTQMLLTMTLDCPATIIIDGLDELDGRLDLLTALRTLVNESSNVVKIMISSREDTDIAQELQDALSIRVSASENSDDIEKFVQHRINSAITDRRLLGGTVSELLKENLINTLLNGANGMFLWPSMQLQYLCDRNIFKVEADVMAALKTLPPTLVGTFDRLYERIHSYGHYGKIIVTRVFAWLLAAERTLTMSELTNAIRVQHEGSDNECISAQQFYNAQTILDLCCNFVSLDESTQRIFFVHASVREYLQGLPSYSISMNNFVAAKRCLELFMFDDEDGIDSDIDDGIDSFREYAICHWAYHYTKATDTMVKSKLDNILKQFVSAEEEMTFDQWLEDVKELVESKRPGPSHLKELNTILNDHGSVVFTASVYGIPAILEKVESEALYAGRTVDYNAKNANGVSALYISARYGHADTLRFLLQHGAKVDVAGGFFGNPLQAAAFHGHQDVVRILVEEKADVFAPGKFTSALDAALTGGNEQIIMILLEASNITDPGELEKVLLRASHDGHYEVVCQLLNLLSPTKASHDCRVSDDSRRYDALQMALFQGRARIARKMLKDIGNVNLETGHFGNALQSAAFGGHPMMVSMVLERGASIDSRGRYGTALRAAALRGHDTVVRLLVDRGARIALENADAMEAAASNGHLSTVKILIESALYTNSGFFYTKKPAIKAACFKGYFDIAKLFLETGGKKAAFFAFDAAMEAGQETIIRLALEYDPKLKNSELPDGSEMYCSAGGGLSLLPKPQFHVCHRCRHRANGKDADQSDGEAGRGEAPGHSGSKFNGRLPWLELDQQGLQTPESFPNSRLAGNRDISIGNGRFLRIAARHGYIDIINRLLDQGFDINTTGNYTGPSSGQSTPIEVAAASGQTGVVKLFLNKGAKVGNALSYAVRNQNVGVIQLLLQDFPEIPLDEPAYKTWTNYFSNRYSRYSKSAISVAVVWNLPHVLEILVNHAKQRGHAVIGQGLVTAAREQHPDLLRSILSGFRLANHLDNSPTASEQYVAFSEAAKQAAHNRDVDMIRILLDHVVAESTKRRLIDRFLKESIIEANWCTALWDVTVAFTPSFYDYLPQVAFKAIAAKVDPPPWSRKFDKSQPRVVDMFRQIYESYRMSDFTYAEAFIEAAKKNNVEIVRLLMHGRQTDYWTPAQGCKAPWINHKDKYGNTALYYACTKGHAEMYHTLVEAGADLNTHYSPYSCNNDSAESSEQGSESGSQTNEKIEAKASVKETLLQISLDARLHSEWSGPATSVWEKPLEKTWGTIVCSLVDAGLEANVNSPSLVKFFYISCFQGKLDYVKKLLARGVSLVGKAGSGNGHMYELGTALHAATVGGQMAVAKLLVEHGADVRIQADNRYLGKPKNWTAIEAALKKRILSHKPQKYHAVLETCAYLVDSGAAESDAKLVLSKACEDGNVEITKRMLQHAARVQGLSTTDNAEIYHFCVHSRSYINSQPGFIANLQLGAIRLGDISFLAGLVHRYGPQDGPDMTRKIATALVECEGDRASVLRYLSEKFCFNVNMIYPVRSRSTTMINPLLQATCISRNPDAVQFLLQEGVDPDSPDLRYTPLMSTLKSLVRIRQRQSTVRIVKILLQYGADVHGSREIDRESDGRLKGNFDKTPLMYAIRSNAGCSDALEVVQLLIEHGADVNHGDIKPLQLARYFNIPEVENLLLRYGAKDCGDATLSVENYVEELMDDDIY